MDVCDVAVELAAGEVVLENLRGGGEVDGCGEAREKRKVSREKNHNRGRR